MASIERTAYPRFKRHPSARELRDVYTPTDEEVDFITSAATRGSASMLSLAVFLKTFQRLGYFPQLEDVPSAVVTHIRCCLRLTFEVTIDVTPRTLYRHHQAVRDHLRVEPWGPKARHVATAAMHRAAQVMDNPADLINVAIEELVRQRFELPAFSGLNRLGGRVRALVNGRLFAGVLERLTAEQLARLDRLLDPLPGDRRTAYNDLKELPKKPTIAHLGELLAHLEWLEALGDVASLLCSLTPAKVRHFAAEARALDAAEMRDITTPKRSTLLLCLIARAQVKAHDDLAGMFIRLMNRIQAKGKEQLEKLRAQHRETTEALVGAFAEVLEVLNADPPDAEAGRRVKEVVAPRGGPGRLLADCVAVSAYHGDNYLPLLWRFYRGQRGVLFRLVRALHFTSTSQDRSLIKALELLLAGETRTAVWLPPTVELSFASEQWQRTMLVGRGENQMIERRHFEVCVFSSLAIELRSGDVAVTGSDEYSDYRDHLLAWEECEPQIAAYCQEVGLPETADALVDQLRSSLAETAEQVDQGYPANGQLEITADGEPVLKRTVRRDPSPSAQALEAAVIERMPERNILDILWNVEFWTGWTRHFGPLSGSDPKLDDPVQRYLLMAFTYGCNLGPTQAARHMPGVTAHMLSFANRRHCNQARLDAALRDIINAYHRCGLTWLWGNPKVAAADGSKYDLSDQSLLAEYHIRYGGYGGIAYRHVSDTYVALFSHFIPCGVWEAIYIIEGLLRNTSDIQPDTVHSDTQGASAPVFALSHLLGIKLMPRIRNWKDLRFYRPSKGARYRHIDSLFSDTIDWEKIATHWQDLMRVVLSIKAGTISSPVLLRKLGTYSRKNRLYQAFREVGRVIRTIFLLQFLADPAMREQITASTNKVEAFHGFAKWLHFGGEGTTIADSDPEELEKHIKYNDLVANAAALQNVVDMTLALRDLAKEGHDVRREDVAALSPYLTRSIKRFGQYVLPLEAPAVPFVADLPLPFEMGDLRAAAS